MNELMNDCVSVLTSARFETRAETIPAVDENNALEVLVFEDATVAGFVIIYESAQQLLDSWKRDGNRVAMRFRRAFQTAQAKAWNAYLVLICRENANFEQSMRLGQIEEDLQVMRKITKAGVSGENGARAALLPLLPFRAAPSLDPIDMHSEIGLRSTELGEEVVEAFLSTADEKVVIRLLEDNA